jgi:hypothetical protein
MSTDFNYNRFTALDNTLTQYSVFSSAYKNIRFAVPATQTLQISEPDVGNLPGLAFRIYGDVSLWRMIMAYNGMQDPLQDMWPGQILKLPSKAAVIAYLSSQTPSKPQTVVI